MKQPILLIGGGGHCKSCIDVIEESGNYNIIGIIDKLENIGQKVSGYEIIATDEEICKLIKSYKNVFITIGQIKNPSVRIKVFDEIKENGGLLPVIISPFAHVSNSARIGEGTIVMHNCVINSGAVVGVNCIINTSAIVEHDSIVGDFTHLSTGSIINGDCNIGREVFIGSNAVVHNGIDICDASIIGAGSVVYRSIKKPGIYLGDLDRRIEQ